jgi:signal transduction histidine kinase
MSVARAHTRDVPGRAFVAAVLAAPAVALVLEADDEASLSRLLHIGTMLTYALVLGAAVLSYLRWRAVCVARPGGTDERLTQWLTVGLTALVANGLLQLVISEPRDTGWLVLVQLAVLAVLCACAALADRVDVPGGPAAVCAGIAIAVPVVCALVQQVPAPVTLRSNGGALLNAAVCLVSLLLAWILLDRTRITPWARRRIAAAAVLLNLSECLQNLGAHHAPVAAAAIATGLIGALALCALTTQLLRETVLDQQSEVEELQHSLADVRAAIARERELLHEVGATLAGITTASRVIRQGGTVTTSRRQRLESMLAAELARLERLMDHRTREDRDVLMYLDDVVEPIVTSHLARGRTVSWQPSGHDAIGNPDELAELCNILLENAARHAPGTPVTLTVRARGDGVEVICSDTGPGVSPELRQRIFETEVKGEDSPGSGLGLAIAHRFAAARGGRLDLVDDGRPGATFAAWLPVKDTSTDMTKDLTKDVADEHAAHVA